MNKQELLKTIDRVVGTDGSLRIPSWWMHKILSDIVRYCEGKGNGDADELRDEIYNGLPDEAVKFLKENGVVASIVEEMQSNNSSIRDINERIGALESRQLVIISNELPENPKSNTIYLVPAQSVGGDNIFAEWVYINGSWEKFGEFNAGADFSQFAKKSEIPTKTSQLTNDSGFITKSSAPDWNASTYKDGHIKNRTHHMQDYMCHYFKGSPIKISKPRDVGYILLTYDTDLADKFVRIEINANESKTYEFVDAMGMPLIFRWDAGASTINVESFMGAVDTYGMRAYYSSSAKGYDEYFVALDEGFIPQGIARKSDMPSIGEHEKVHVVTSKEELGKLYVPMGSIGSIVSEGHTFEVKPSQVEPGTIIKEIKFNPTPPNYFDYANEHNIEFGFNCELSSGSSPISVGADKHGPSYDFFYGTYSSGYVYLSFTKQGGQTVFKDEAILSLNEMLRGLSYKFNGVGYRNSSGQYDEYFIEIANNFIDSCLTFVCYKPAEVSGPYVKISNSTDEPTPRKFSDFGNLPELFSKEERIVKNFEFLNNTAFGGGIIGFETIGGSVIKLMQTGGGGEPPYGSWSISYDDDSKPLTEEELQKFKELVNSTTVYYTLLAGADSFRPSVDTLVSADFPLPPLKELKTWTPVAAPISSDDIDSLLAEVFGGGYYYSDDGIGSWDDYAYEVDGIGEFEEGEINVEELNIENNETGS